MITASRRRRRSGARRNDRPQPCQRCLRRIVWGLVLEPDGSLRRRDDGTLVHVPLNADPVPHGLYEYVRGAAGRPVVRELDDPERLVGADGHRYDKHLDTVREEPRDHRPGAEP